ncbi:MAG: xylulokinase [Candidatus Sumerlaeaceae bacterium]|nr:xylulokinase [Candidatus Sumerlaeaceae bacterium]
MKNLIGVDIGTTGAKSVLINERGKVLASDFREYPLSLPKPGWAEQNPEDWWAATVVSLRNLLAKSGVSARSLEGISFSGQMHGLVCLDDGFRVLRPAILWCDTRTTAECRLIEQKLGGRAKLISLASNPALEGFTLPKLLWVRRNEPATYRKICHIMLPKDYVRFRLTGALGMDMSDAAGTLMLDVRRKRWSREILAGLEIDSAILPLLAESPDIAGSVTPQAAAETGLPVGLPVAFGGADNTCAAVGNGVIREGIVAVSIGTSGTVVAPTERAVRDKLGRVHTFNHSVPGLWYAMGCMQAAGLSLKWLRDTFGGLERAMASQTGIDAYEFLTAGAADVPPGAEGLIWLPYLNGERTPHLDANARGVLYGITPRHTRAHVARAILEGVVFGLRDGLEIIRGLKIPIGEIRLTGGGARSPLWRQIQADVFRQQVVTINVEEGPAFGAAIIAGVGTGVFPSFDEATRRVIRVTGVVKPNQRSADAYERAYRLFRELYTDLKGTFARTARA